MKRLPIEGLNKWRRRRGWPRTLGGLFVEFSRLGKDTVSRINPWLAVVRRDPRLREERLLCTFYALV